MARIATGDPKTTSTTFSVQVLEIGVGETLRFWLYYEGNPRVAVSGCEGKEGTSAWFGPVATAGAHTFSASGLRSNADLVYTIRLLPSGKTNWETEAIYVADEKTAKTDPDTPTKTWPGDWTKWANLKAGDPTTAVTADDWNDFLDHINAVIDYKGGTKVTLTKVSKGDKMKANYFNSGAATAMRSIGLSPPSAKQGDPITADFFVQYGKALNAAK